VALRVQDPDQENATGIPSRTWKIAAVAGAGAFMAMLDATVVNLAIPQLCAELTASLATVQWVVTGYLVALASSLPAAGWLGSRFGHGRTWAASLGLFTLGSVACATATGPLTLIGSRLAQGLAAGVMVPSGQAVIASSVRRDQLGRIMGTLGLVIALGPAVGPGVGGLLLETGSWRWLFWMNVPVGVVVLAAARGLIPPGEPDAGRRLDRLGLLLIGSGSPLALYGATQIGSAGVRAMPAMALVAGAVLIVAFIVAALRRHRPLIDLHLLRSRSVAGATGTVALTGASMYAGLLLLPLYLRASSGEPVTATGFLLLVMGLGSALVLPVAGTLTDRHGARRVTTFGATLLAITTLPFLAPSDPSTPALAVILAARGAGLALAQMPAMTAAYTAVARERVGDATTLVNLAQRMGGAAGVVAVVIAIGHPGDGTGMYVGGFAVLMGAAVLILVAARPMRRAVGAAAAE